MDFLLVLLNAAIFSLLAWYGLGKLVSKNLFARWFFETKIVRGYQKERLEKFKNQQFVLFGFEKAPELGQKIYQILRLSLNPISEV